jgi:mannitol-1-phosphate 5-dehydrogenase
MSLVRAAFIEESGEALIRKHQGVDSLFTKQGWDRYANDLLERMTNSYLRDTVERVGRDPARKLGWDDRLIGTMRMALSQGVQPIRYALGAAAALAQVDPSILKDDAPIQPILASLWNQAASEQSEQERVLQLIGQARQRLKRWVAAGFRDFEQLVE